jgi:hypothetical protein
MRGQPTTDSVEREPFWQVQAVFDPDGGGKDFAYTIGLHERGVPELHMWARPSLGEDPGDDWMLSMHDRCAILNELSWMLLDGKLGVGSELEREYDEGLAHVTFRVDPPGDREQLEAFGAPPDVDVLPVRWSLRRPAEGPPIALTSEAQRRARDLYDDLVGGLDAGASPPPGWTLPGEPHFGVDQKFGPLTSTVLARAAQLWQASDESLAALLRSALIARHGCSLTEPTSMAIALGRSVGRRKHLQTLHRAVHDVVRHLTERPAAQRRWHSVAAHGFPVEECAALGAHGREQVQRNLARVLHDVATSCLMVEAVADQAGQSLLLRARGPWLSGLRDEPVLTAPEWRAAPAMLARLRDLLEPLDAHGLTIIGRIHRIASERSVIEAPGYDDLCTRLKSWAMTSAANCPWEPVLAGLPGWQPLRKALPDAAVGPMPDLEDWATCFTSALTHRARLTSEEVATFAYLYEVDLPQLASVLNTPL